MYRHVITYAVKLVYICTACTILRAAMHVNGYQYRLLVNLIADVYVHVRSLSSLMQDSSNLRRGFISGDVENERALFIHSKTPSNLLEMVQT